MTLPCISDSGYPHQKSPSPFNHAKGKPIRSGQNQLAHFMYKEFNLLVLVRRHMQMKDKSTKQDRASQVANTRR